MIDLSYVILLADKAGNYYYNSLIKKIQEISTHINYEIVIVDVRERTKHELSDFSNVVYVDAKRNVRQMAGRRLGANVAKGKYLWFIDDDDYPVAVPDMSSDVNMIVHNAAWYASPEEEHLDLPLTATNTQHIKKQVTGNKDILPFGSIYRMGVGYCLWSRLVKTEVYKEVYNSLPEDIDDISYAEDIFILRCLLKRNITVALVPEVCYYVRAYESTTALEMFNNDDYEKTCLLPLTGYDKLKQLAIRELGEEEGKYFTYENLGLFIQKALNGTPSVRKKLLNHLTEIEDKDIVFYIGIRHLGPDYTNQVLDAAKEYYQGMSTFEILKRIMKQEVLCGKERYHVSAYC